MRVYSRGKEVVNETIREVFSRGIKVFDKTVQGKIVDRGDYEQMELLNYEYKFLDPSAKNLHEIMTEAHLHFGKSHLTFELACRWFETFFHTENPEGFWAMDPSMVEYWKKFGIESNGKFSYTYGERLNYQIALVLQKLRRNLDSRGAYLGVWDQGDSAASLQGRRVPCTIGYHLLYRFGRLNMIIDQRSCDLVNFFALDIVKAGLLLDYYCNELKVPKGYIVHKITSLHAYRLDVPDDRKW